MNEVIGNEKDKMMKNLRIILSIRIYFFLSNRFN